MFLSSIVEVHHIIPSVATVAQKPIFSTKYVSRHDDAPCLKGDYIVLPGEGFLTVTKWGSGQTVEIDLVSVVLFADPESLFTPYSAARTI